MNQFKFLRAGLCAARSFWPAIGGLAVAAAGASLELPALWRQQARQRRATAGRMAAKLRNRRTSCGQSRNHAGPVAGDARGDRSGDPAISGHRCARRLECRCRPGARIAGRRQIQGRAGACGSGWSSRAISIRSPAVRPVFDSFVEAAVKRFQARHGHRRDRHRQRADLQRAQYPRRCAASAIGDQYRSPARLFRQSWRAVRDGQHSGRRGRDGRERRRLFASRRRRRQDRSPVADHAGQGDADQFQSVLDGAAFADQEGPDPQDAGRSDLSDRRENPRLQQGRPGSLAAVDQLEFARRDQLQISPGHRRRHQFARLRARQHPQSLRRLYARHAVEGDFRRRFPLRLVGLRARAGRARLCRLAA